MKNTFSTSCELPATGYIRQNKLTTNSRNIGILPFSGATLWRMVRLNKFPKPIKLSERITAWKVEDVREWIASRNAS